MADDIKIRKLRRTGHIIRTEDERIHPPPKKRFLMGNFIIQDQWENHEQDGRTSSRRTYHRS